jgi:eukaryotic-like serine/threonine-protein kinase
VAEVAGQTLVDKRYRITGRIGSGGMADVYCADDTHLGREVAIKILHRRFAQDAEFVERFRREASAAAGLQHPNVVGVFDRGSHDGTWYIAMERLKGRTLKQLITDDAPVDQLRAIDLMIQILQAAGFAHKRGVVHRDFKPHNVIVADDDAVKVTDFGIARAGASEMTETGSIMGTAQYLSPEQAQGQRVDARSDLYSIGVILFELLTSRVPFNGESAVSIALKHVSEPAPSVATLRRDVHPALEAVVARALVKDPAGRFQSAEEFILALDEARRAIATGRPGEGTTRFAPLGPPPPDDGVPRRGRRWPLVLLALILLAIAGVATYLGTRPDQVQVPPVNGDQVAPATQRLERHGFKVAVEQRRDASPAGTVLGSQPAQGAKADKGSTVTLFVSSGPGTASVPDVHGFSESRAQKTLAKAGFKYQSNTQPSTTIGKGKVISTDPPPGTMRDVGSRVLLNVSSGPPQVTVPDVRGLTKSSAVRALENLNLGVSQVEAFSDQPKGQVIAQSFDPGATVDEGTKVTITVSKGKEKVAVPNVVGQAEADAKAALEKAGFTVRATSRPVTDPNQDGQVLEQKPPADSQRVKGSTVEIVVGHLSATPTPPTNPTPTPPPPSTTPGATGTTGTTPRRHA